MSPQLVANCLNEIFEHLDEATLQSCLLVNHLWCEVSVRILWRDVWNFSTLIACLPNESKKILYKKGIVISTPTSKPLMFNYAAFCKILSGNGIHFGIEHFLKNQLQIVTIEDVIIVAQELYKLIMNQNSLKILDFDSFPHVLFTNYPGAEDCLKDLTILRCRSDIHPEFFYKLTEICHNIQSLYITFEQDISNGLTDLISVQRNLRCLNLFYGEDLAVTIPSLKVPNSLTKLGLCGDCIPISFITKFTNLQELELSFDSFENFNGLQDAKFTRLEILRFSCASPRYDLTMKFLENNGKNLKELYVYDNDNSLNSAVAKFCPNLRKLDSFILYHALDILKEIFNNCQYLESFRVNCGDRYLNEKELFDVIAKYSPKNVCSIKFHYYSYKLQSEILPHEFESFFTNWANRIPRKPLSLIIVKEDNDDNSLIKNLKIVIEKYTKLGVIKGFRITNYGD